MLHHMLLLPDLLLLHVHPAADTPATDAPPCPPPHPHPDFIDDKARFPRRLITLCCDGVAILIGALLGTSPLAVVAESSVGIKEGGRTGVTAFALGLGFTIAMFFAPIFSSIPG
jgi:hypothetical protein